MGVLLLEPRFLGRYVLDSNVAFLLINSRYVLCSWRCSELVTIAEDENERHVLIINPWFLSETLAAFVNNAPFMYRGTQIWYQSRSLIDINISFPNIFLSVYRILSISLNG